MVRIKIGLDERTLDEVSESWIAQQITKRKQSGDKSVCVEVMIREDDLNLRLATPGCPKAGGVRQANRHEREIINLWKKRGLNDSSFSPGNVIAFLRQLRRLL